MFGTITVKSIPGIPFINEKHNRKSYKYQKLRKFNKDLIADSTSIQCRFIQQIKVEVWTGDLNLNREQIGNFQRSWGLGEILRFFKKQSRIAPWDEKFNIKEEIRRLRVKF